MTWPDLDRGMIVLGTVMENGLEGEKGELGDQVEAGCRSSGRKCCGLAWW